LIGLSLLTSRIKESGLGPHSALAIVFCLILWAIPTIFISHNSFDITSAEAQEEMPQSSSPQSGDGDSSSTASSTLSSPQILGQNLEDVIRPYVGYITFAIDVSAGVIIGISAIMGLISFLKILRKPLEQQTQDKETIRLRLARGMLLALDFEVGSDILKTVLVPSVRELTILAVVVGIRIVLSWSLSKEIGRHSDMKASQSEVKARKLAFKTTTHDEEGSTNDNIDARSRTIDGDKDNDSNFESS
jgi:uncharacterized membrane protein